MARITKLKDQPKSLNRELQQFLFSQENTNKHRERSPLKKLADSWTAVKN